MSQSVLLDTDVLSYFLKDHSRAVAFRPLVEGKEQAISFMSVAELYQWALKRHWGDLRVQRLEARLRLLLVVPYDQTMAWVWARLMTACDRAGRPMATSDGWIAATALRCDVPLVTNNVEHFEAAERTCGLQLLRLP